MTRPSRSEPVPQSGTAPDPVHIREARDADAAAIAAIWNHYIRHTHVTFNSAEKPVEEVAALIAARAPRHGTLVATRDGAVTGFASYSQFRGGVGYRASVEHTILLHPGQAGQGTGRHLMAALLAHARAQGHHVMVAGVSAANPAGQKFHAAMGFEPVGHLRQVGQKDGIWLDLILMQRLLENPA